MEKSEKISSFYCKKCKEIPLIELYPKENEIKILLTCDCRKQFLIRETFLKNYYKKDININEIKEKKGVYNSSKTIHEKINNLIKSYQEKKEQFEANCLKIKEESINIFRNIIKKIESIYELNKTFNNKINNFIQILINNYKSNPNNQINQYNIIINANNGISNAIKNINLKSNNLDIIIKNVDDFFQNNYIIKPNKLKLKNNFIDRNSKKLIIEIKSNLFANKFNNYEIQIFNLNTNNKWISIRLENIINNLLIDENKNYLISVDGEQFIKFWNINELENKLKENYENNKINILPSYQFTYNDKILELINIGNFLMCGIDKENIFIYNYNIEERTSQIINKLKIKVDNLNLVIRKNEKYICCKHKNYLIFINLPELLIINKIKIGKWENIISFSYEQINDNEIIIGQENYLKIINLNNFKNTISKKLNFGINCTKKLDRNTILVGGKGVLKRFSLKTLEEVPELIELNINDNDSDSDDESDGFLGVGFLKDLSRNIISIKKLSNGEIMVILKFSINIYKSNIDFYSNDF